ncbi:MAG: transcriptional regulator [Rhodospirillaceae bacterium]|nr:transcriptional regulator [Rhodospirillaceae bacterium]|tara:strand:- start:995 stop:1429 length:435 start_codon:yes stop_codon:yes gene_type:complete
MAMETSGTGNLRRNGKSRSAYRTISEVSNEIDVPAHVLRFWETKFLQIKPLKRGGGRRYYRPEDVTLLKTIRQFLYSDGYTIKGVQRLLKDGLIKTASNQIDTESNVLPVASEIETVSVSMQNKNEIKEIMEELKALKRLLSEL